MVRIVFWLFLTTQSDSTVHDRFQIEWNPHKTLNLYSPRECMYIFRMEKLKILQGRVNEYTAINTMTGSTWYLIITFPSPSSPMLYVFASEYVALNKKDPPKTTGKYFVLTNHLYESH